jgi:peptide/nickel transport system ATP-binding protein
MFGGGEGRVVKANETISASRRASPRRGHRRRIRLRQVDARQGAARAGNGEFRQRSRSATRKSSRPPIEKRDVDTVSSIQMVFQNPFDTLNPSHSVGSQIIRTLEKFGVGKTAPTARSACWNCSTW